MLIFPPKTNPKNSVPNRNQVQNLDRGYGEHSSPKQLRKLIFAQLEVLPTALFCFLKEVNYMKSFLGFFCFYLKHGFMYIFRLSSVLFIQKLSVGKEFRLVERGFGQRVRNTLRNSMRQI